jgi:hypothetical protein
VRAARCWGYKLQASRLLGNAGCSTRLLLALSLDQMSAMPPFTRLGWGALLEARALTAAGLEPRRMIMALARPALLQATKARRVEPERALCKPASGPRLDAVVSGRSPISHDLDLDCSCSSPAQRVRLCVRVRVLCHQPAPSTACRCPNRVQRNGQPLCSRRTTNGVRCGLAQTPVIRDPGVWPCHCGLPAIRGDPWSPQWRRRNFGAAHARNRI